MAGVPAPTPGFEPTTKQMNEVRLSKFTNHPLTLPPNDVAYAMALYDGEIRYVDEWFSGFWKVVCDLGLDRRATVVFLSDHGEEFQEHGSVMHEKLYATVTRIPFMIRLPGGRLARRVDAVVESVDLMPTLLELAGAPAPAGIQGASLLPLLLGQPTDGPHAAFSESPFFGLQRAVTLGEMRMVFTQKTGSVELYDYRKDPLEQIDVAQQRPAGIEAGRQLLEAWETMVASSSVAAAPDQPLDEETLEQLRRLGYVQ
jgi:arylsulfatase A-like enzyme